MRKADKNIFSTFYFAMDAWAIILITIGSGLALFIALFICKSRRAHRRHATAMTPSIMVANNAAIPSPHHAPLYNMGTPPQVFQYTTPAHYPIQGNNYVGYAPGPIGFTASNAVHPGLMPGHQVHHFIAPAYQVSPSPSPNTPQPYNSATMMKATAPSPFTF